MKNTVLTLATLAALSSGQMGEVGNLINGAEQAIGTAIVDVASDGVSHLGNMAGATAMHTASAQQGGVVYAKLSPYRVKAQPYNVMQVKFSNNSGGFGSKSSFGF